MPVLTLVDSCRSAIIFPQDKSVITHDGFIELKGWAYSGGGNWVERVEVSPDGCVFTLPPSLCQRTHPAISSLVVTSGMPLIRMT